MNWTSPPPRLATASLLLSLALALGSGCDMPHDSERTSGMTSAGAFVDPTLCTGSNALAEAAGLVALGPRHAATAEGLKAARYLSSRLTAIGGAPTLDAFQAMAPGGTSTFHNVTCLIGGQDASRTIALVSHFDTKSGLGPDFVGANDSGSSCGLLLELARLYLQDMPPINVLLAFVDGEECQHAYGPHDGLHGSRRLAQQIAAARDERGPLSTVEAVIVVDMIGDRDLEIVAPLNSDRELVRLAYAAARDVGLRKLVSRGNSMVLDDHVPFLNHGTPAIDLIDFSYGSAPGKNDYWHTAEDTMDKLSAESLESTGRIVVQMVNRWAGWE